MVLRHIRDVEFFEGPLLSLFHNEDDEPYLYHWCDCSDHLTRWLVFRTTKHLLAQYETKGITLMALISSCRDRFVYVCDLDVEGETQAVSRMNVKDIPDDYLPVGDTYFSGEIVQPREAQDVLISGANWGYERIARFPRKYLQAYSFTRLFGKRGSPSAFQSSLDLTSGWVFHTLYEGMRRASGRLRADLAEVSIASPGYMRMKVENDAAADLREVVERYLQGATEINATTRALRAWSNERESFSEDKAKALVLLLETKLGIKPNQLLRRTATLKDAAKILTSYVTRIEFLAKYHQTELARIVGVSVPDERVDTALRAVSRRTLDRLMEDDD